MAESLSNKLSLEQIAALCQRGFGSKVQIDTVEEIGGGTFNETYRIELANKGKIILRVAPAPTVDIFWDDIALMRREHHILPFFASIANLMPNVLMTDFTHLDVQSSGEPQWRYTDHRRTPGCRSGMVG